MRRSKDWNAGWNAAAEAADPLCDVLDRLSKSKRTPEWIKRAIRVAGRKERMKEIELLGMRFANEAAKRRFIRNNEQ